MPAQDRVAEDTIGRFVFALAGRPEGMIIPVDDPLAGNGDILTPVSHNQVLMGLILVPCGIRISAVI